MKKKLKKIISLFNIIVMTLIVVGCSNPIQNEIKQKIEQVEKIKKKIELFQIFELVQTKENATKIKQVEKQLEKQLSIEMVSATEKEIQLKITTVPFEKMLEKSKSIFEDSTQRFEEQLKSFKRTISELGKQERIVIYSSIKEINSDQLFIKLFQSDKETIEQFQSWIESFMPVMNY